MAVLLTSIPSTFEKLVQGKEIRLTGGACIMRKIGKFLTDIENDSLAIRSITLSLLTEKHTMLAKHSKGVDLMTLPLYTQWLQKTFPTS